MLDPQSESRAVLRKELQGRLIAGLRVRQKLTQAELGDRLELSQSAIDRLEAGHSSIGLETLFDFAGALASSGAFVVCLLDALIEEVIRDGYLVVASPPRRSQRQGSLPAPALSGRVLAAYVTAWLERNRDAPPFAVHGTVDGWRVAEPPVHSEYAPVVAVEMAYQQ